MVSCQDGNARSFGHVRFLSPCPQDGGPNRPASYANPGQRRGEGDGVLRKCQRAELVRLLRENAELRP